MNRSFRRRGTNWWLRKLRYPAVAVALIVGAVVTTIEKVHYGLDLLKPKPVEANAPRTLPSPPTQKIQDRPPFPPDRTRDAVTRPTEGRGEATSAHAEVPATSKSTVENTEALVRKELIAALERLASRPSRPLLELVYLKEPALTNDGSHVGLSLQVAVHGRRRNTETFSPLREGAELSSGDAYSLAVKPLSKGHLYVFQIDELGKVEWLFPSNSTSKFSGGRNPVTASVALGIPDSGDGRQRAFTLDKQIGIEHVYFILVPDRWPELEAEIGKVTATQRITRGQQQVPSVVREPNKLRLRGIEDVVLTKQAATDPNQTFSESVVPAGVAPLSALGSFVVKSTTGPLVVERTINHVN